LVVSAALCALPTTARAELIGVFPNPASQGYVTLSLVDEIPGGRLDVFNSATGRWHGYAMLVNQVQGRTDWRITLPGPGVFLLRYRSEDGTTIYRRVVTLRANSQDSRLSGATLQR
jgi:hypothetical protein